jgi:DNA primase
MKKLMCAEARQIDLVDYLASLGHQPQKVRNQDYWYLSPLRNKKIASFKVERAKQNIANDPELCLLNRL